MRKNRILWMLFFTLILSLTFVSIANAQTDDPDTVIVQDEEPVEPAALEKVSWEAVFAGAVVALVLELTLNLLGISIGFLSLQPDYDEEMASPKVIGMGTAVWVILSGLIALFVGGWVAGRLANMPDDTDGALHGILTACVVTLISIVFLMTTVGRLLSGISTLVGQSLMLAGRAAQAVTSGAADVAQAAIGGAAKVTAAAAGGAANLAQGAASGAANAAQNVGDMAMDAAYRMAEESPEVRDALELQDLSFDTIKNEFMSLVRRAGISPEGAQSQAQGVMRDASAAAQYAAQHPEDAERMANYLLRRVLRRGQSVVEDTDRQEVVRALAERAGVSEQEAYETLGRWENVYNQAKVQTEQAREMVMQRFQQMRQDAMTKAEELQRQVEQKAAEAQRKAEQTARQAAEATMKAIAALAGTAFAGLVLSAFAAALGGIIGAPEESEVVETVSQVISWIF